MVDTRHELTVVVVVVHELLVKFVVDENNRSVWDAADRWRVEQRYSQRTTTERKMVWTRMTSKEMLTTKNVTAKQNVVLV